MSTFFTHLADIDGWTAAVGAVTLVAALVGKRLLPRVPYMLTGMIVGSVFAYVLARAGVAKVATIGALPSAIPGLSLPDFSAGTWRTLAPAALALTLIGLTEAVSSARAVAARSGERIDGNQEFIGQGLANIAGAFTSSYPTSGSFNRSGANFEAGARTPLAAIFSAGFLLADSAVRLAAGGVPSPGHHGGIAVPGRLGPDRPCPHPRDRAREPQRNAGAGGHLPGDPVVQLEFAVLVGVLCSLLVYLNRTTHSGDPHGGAGSGIATAPLRSRDSQRGRASARNSRWCASTAHCSSARSNTCTRRFAGCARAAPARAHLLLIGSGINFVDVAGAELLVREAQASRTAAARFTSAI